ncbi:MAG: starch-binding protein, partial [Muribaculaceae bacterium]|nr:starch-binding protein [Muribaculaceae bacterium]
MKKFLFLIACLTCLCLWPSAKAAAQTYVYETGQQVIVNHQIYKVTGANVVTNGDFANGTYAGWVSTDAGNAVDASAWEISNDGPNGAKYLHNTGKVGGGSGTANNIRCAWDLDAGKTYLVSYYTKGSNSNVRFWNSALEGVKTPDNPLALLEGSNSEDWMQNITVFETTAEAHKALLNCAWCGSGFGVTYISIVPVEYVGEEQVEWTTIEPDTYYNLQIQGTDLYLSAGWQEKAQQVLMLALDQAGYEHAFKFVPVDGKEGVYNLIGKDGKAIWANGNWNCHWTSEPTEANLADAAYQFSVESEVGYILIKTKNKYIGCDNINAWASVYTDKSGSAILKFVPKKVVEEVPVTVYYDNIVTNWDEVYAYMWNDEGNNGEWPGNKMTKGEGTIWSYTFTGFEPTKVIFNNGNGQQTADLDFEADKTYGDTSVEFYLRGDMNGWGTDAKFETADNVLYTLSGVNIGAGQEFKIATSAWNIAYGYNNEPMQFGVEYTLSTDGSNMTLAEAMANGSISFDFSTGKATFTQGEVVAPVKTVTDGLNNANT